jgi:hypothetical protein
MNGYHLILASLCLISCAYLRAEPKHQRDPTPSDAVMAVAEASITEWNEELLMAKTLFDSVNEHVLRCFHNGPTVSVDNVGNTIYTIDGDIVSRGTRIIIDGALRRYFMDTRYELKISTFQFRAIPIREDTLFNANPDCGYLRWTDIDDIIDTADRAVAGYREKWIRRSVMVVSILNKDLRGCLLDAAKDKAVEAAVDAIVDDPGSVSRLAEAINQLRKDGQIDPVEVERSGQLEALASELDSGGTESQLFATLIRNRDLAKCLVAKLRG